MDLEGLPERDRLRMTRLIEAKQAEQFLSLYSNIVSTCFTDCIVDFTSEAMGKGEKECIKKCTTKYLRLTNRIGQQMAEKQMMPPS